MTYQVWSTQRPALYHDRQGRQFLAGGTINKLTYGGKAIDPKAALPVPVTLQEVQWMVTMPKVATPKVQRVAGSKGKTYIVKTWPNGREECSCPGYTFRRVCKHIKEK